MEPFSSQLTCSLAQESILRKLLEGTSTVVGERFFEALVIKLADVMQSRCAWVTEYISEQRLLKALAFWDNGRFIDDFSVKIDDTPCEQIIDRAQFVHYPDNIQELFPNSLKLSELGAVSYMGVPLLDLDGTILGHLAVIDNRTMPENPENVAVFQIFAARAAAELQRLRAESEARDRREKLDRIVDSAMDAIIELDEQLDIRLFNPAARNLFKFPADCGPVGPGNLRRFLTTESLEKVSTAIKALHQQPDGNKKLWVPGNLYVLNPENKPVSAEATLAQFQTSRGIFYTIILRSNHERIEAERRISSLMEEADYLKDEIRELGGSDTIIGKSPGFQKVLTSVQQVAPTDSTVLILGETGTGKELIARAVHQASRRSQKPFVKLNCAALPATLIESELFGHEAGAFTGADRRRRGRFEIADAGTLFLDEISEMSIQMQARLLRVIQEGQFERVGGSTTLKVDVRLIAATNRKLNEEILSGRFRADLYYRIHVYPIAIPPLRDRPEDIVPLARYFVSRIGARLGKVIDYIPAATIEQLMAYYWPGNARELKNVIERAIITSPANLLLLPEELGGRSTETVHMPRDSQLSTLETVERQYISHVLQTTGWRISGPKGAAKILGLNPSTLRFKIKKLGVRTPWQVETENPV